MVSISLSNFPGKPIQPQYPYLLTTVFVHRYSILNGRDQGRGQGPVCADDVQVRVRRRAFRRRQGRHQDRPQEVLRARIGEDHA